MFDSPTGILLLESYRYTNMRPKALKLQGPGRIFVLKIETRAKCTEPGPAYQDAGRGMRRFTTKKWSWGLMVIFP